MLHCSMRSVRVAQATTVGNNKYNNITLINSDMVCPARRTHSNIITAFHTRTSLTTSVLSTRPSGATRSLFTPELARVVFLLTSLLRLCWLCVRCCRPYRCCWRRFVELQLSHTSALAAEHSATLPK